MDAMDDRRVEVPRVALRDLILLTLTAADAREAHLGFADSLVHNLRGSAREVAARSEIRIDDPAIDGDLARAADLVPAG